jgi:WhiB family redox-sensing transcriptional regulator
MAKAAVLDVPGEGVAPAPRWHGVCYQTSDDRFFPESWETRPHPDIELMCARCPFSSQCLQLALDNPNTEGVWGGTTPYQRRQLRNERNRSRCPGCGSDSIVPQGRGEVCISCGISWLV